MERILALSGLIILLSCGDLEGVSNEPNEETEAQTKELIWVCHNPNTKFHDRECIEGIYPRGCYVKDDASAYCWLLSQNDCENSSQLKWQEKYCPLLEN